VGFQKDKTFIYKEGKDLSNEEINENCLYSFSFME